MDGGAVEGDDLPEFIHASETSLLPGQQLTSPPTTFRKMKESVAKEVAGVDGMAAPLLPQEVAKMTRICILGLLAHMPIACMLMLFRIPREASGRVALVGEGEVAEWRILWQPTRWKGQGGPVRAGEKEGEGGTEEVGGHAHRPLMHRAITGGGGSEGWGGVAGEVI